MWVGVGVGVGGCGWVWVCGNIILLPVGSQITATIQNQTLNAFEVSVVEHLFLQEINKYNLYYLVL